MPWRIPLLISAALLSSTAHAQENTTVEFVDGAKVLMDQLSIPTGPFKRVDECLPLGGGGGFRSRKVPCQYFYVLGETEIAEIKSIELGSIDGNALPTFLENQSFDLQNCTSEKFSYSETAHYTTSDEASLSLTTSLTNVKEFKTNLDVSVVWKAMDLKEESSDTNTIELRIGSETHYSVKHESVIDKPLNITIPPKMSYTIALSDTKKRIQIPVHMTAILRTNQYQEIRALAGNLQDRRLVKVWNDGDSAAKRQVSIGGVLVVKGGDRRLQLRISEKPCSD